VGGEPQGVEPLTELKGAIINQDYATQWFKLTGKCVAAVAGLGFIIGLIFNLCGQTDHLNPLVMGLFVAGVYLCLCGNPHRIVLHFHHYTPGIREEIMSIQGQYKPTGAPRPRCNV
jgi:hypothetical protein